MLFTKEIISLQRHESWRIPAVYPYQVLCSWKHHATWNSPLNTHTLQHKLIYFEAGSGWLTPRLTSPLHGRSLWMASGKGGCPGGLGHKDTQLPSPLTAQEGGPPSGQLKSSSSSCLLQNPSELKPAPSLTPVGFSVNSFSGPEGLNLRFHFFLHSLGRSANQEWQRCKVE